MENTITMSARSLQYYVIARRWQSDLDFFKLETAFLHKLLNRHISQLQDREHISRLVSAGKALQKLELMVMDDLLTGQITQLELMAEDIIPEDAESLAAAQVKLEYFMTSLTKDFRSLKQEIFELVLSENTVKG